MTMSSNLPWALEYKNAVEKCALFQDRSRALIELSGKDRLKFLHGMTTNEIKLLAPKAAIVNTIVGLKGKLLAELMVYNVGEVLWLETDLSTKEIVINTLSKYKVIEDVKLTDKTAEFTKLVFVGPQTSEKIRTETFQMKVPINPTYVLWASHSQTESFMKLAPQLSPNAWDALRIEAGIPRFNIDMGTESLPLESPYLETGISFTKGCYIGQETIVRVAHRGGNVAHRLMGIQFEAENPKEWINAKVFNGEKEVGTLTSATYSPKFKTALGLSLVHRDSFEPGTEIKIKLEEKETSGKIVSLA